jgi:DNA (cytosine-5)-methyltransferase 1
MLPELKCVDLFAGAGGFSLAAIEAGLTIVAAVEFDKNAARTYKNNISKIQKSGIEFHNEDILELDPTALARKLGITSAGCDLVLGGPPCQGFSVHRIRGAGVDDSRNVLILRYFEFVSTLRSKFFLMENVPGILWERHKSYLDEFYAAGDRAGYHVYPAITLDARDFGVPQRRKRVFILGVRKDLKEYAPSWPPKATHGDEQAIADNVTLSPWLNASSVFTQPLSESDPNNVHMKHKPHLVEVFKSTPLNGGSRKQSSRILPCHLSHSGHSDVYGRINMNLPGPTMTTACVNPSKGRFLHPTEHHGISVRHAARFQTFPDWFEFEGGLMASAKQVGNAVPIKFGTVLISQIRDALITYYQGRE